MSKKVTNFASQYKRLEDILEWFDSDDFDLDKAEKRFSEGIKLVEQLEDRIKKAELKITKLEARLDQ